MSRPAAGKSRSKPTASEKTAVKTPAPPVVSSPPWNRNVKVVVGVALLLLSVLIVYRFGTLMRYLVMAAILSYLLNPLINLLAERLPVRRTYIVLVVYLILFAVLVRLLMALGTAGYKQLVNLVNNFPTLVQQSVRFVQEAIGRTYTFSLGGFAWQFGPLDTAAIDVNRLLNEVQNWAVSSWNTLLARGGAVVGGVAQVTLGVLGIVGTLLFILVMSLYISLDSPRIIHVIGDVAHAPGYRADAERLFREFGRIWRAYLRGQVILALTMGTAVWLALAILGVNYAFALGLLAAAVEFLPVIGAPLAGSVTILVALFQSSNWLGLSSWQFALLVALVMLIMQQLENNLLVPRIVGKALDLHPLVTLLAVFMGTSLAGILGAVLAAPVTATAKLLAVYIWRKMFDLEPFEQPEEAQHSTSAGLWQRARQLAAWVRGRFGAAPEGKARRTK